MLKVLRKISGHHSSDSQNEKLSKKNSSNSKKGLRKASENDPPQYPRIPLNPEKKSKPYIPQTSGMEQSRLNSKADDHASNKNSSDSLQDDRVVPMTHEKLIRQNQVNRKKSEHYYIYDFESYRGPSDEEVNSDPDYNIFHVHNGINPTSARYVIHYLTNSFKDQLTNRFSCEQTGLETDVIKLSIEIFKPNLSHFSNSEINHCKKVLRSFFPWEGCSLTGNMLEKSIHNNFGDYNNNKHWTRLILSLRILWAELARGIIPWKSYLDFCEMESKKNFPVMSFYNILPQTLPNHDYTCCTFEFLEILVAIISKIDLVVDKSVQMDLIFTAGQVCFYNDVDLQNHIKDTAGSNPDLIQLGKLYYARGSALFHLFVGYLRSLAEEGKIKDFYLIDNFHIDSYPPHPYKAITQNALTLTIPKFTENENDFNVLMQSAAKSQSRIYSSNHTFSKLENSFLDKFEEDPLKVFETIFSKSSKRYLYKFDKKFDPKLLRFSSTNGFQEGLASIDENDQYAVATWIEHCKGQDFNEFLSVLDDTTFGEGTLAFDHSSFTQALKKTSKKENFAPVRVSKMPVSEWFISSWKYETFLEKVHNTLLLKLTKKIGDCDWLVITTDERVGKSCYLTPPSSSDSAKDLEKEKTIESDADNFSIRSRPPPPNLLGEKSSSPLLESSSSSSIYSGYSRKPLKEFSTPETVHSNTFSRKSKMNVVTSLPAQISNEFMTPVERNKSPIVGINHASKNFDSVPQMMKKIPNPSLLNVSEPRTAHPYNARAASNLNDHTLNSDYKLQTTLIDSLNLVKPLDFSKKISSSIPHKIDETKVEDISDDSINVCTSNQLGPEEITSEIDTLSTDTDSEVHYEDISLSSDGMLHTEHEQSTYINNEERSPKKILKAAEGNATNEIDVASVSNLADTDEKSDGGEAKSDSAENFIEKTQELSSSATEEVNQELSEAEESPKKTAIQADSESDEDYKEVIYHDEETFDEAATEDFEASLPDSIANTTKATSIQSEINERVSITEDKNQNQEEALEDKSIILTPNNRLLRASALIDTQSPNDILNDLIDNYNSESLATVSSEGTTLFEMIKTQMERVSNGKDLPPIPLTKPILNKLKMDIVLEDEEGNDSLPSVTPTKGTSTMISGFSYNATPPMKQEEFKYNSKLSRNDESKSYLSTITDRDHRKERGAEPEDEDHLPIDSDNLSNFKDNQDDNGAFRSVMLKTRKSFKSLRSKPLRT